MIPKIINYCWFGGKPLSQRVKKRIESWMRYCPDYKIVRWDEKNYDLSKNEYVKNTYRFKKWAFLSDYVRLDILSQNGGIYLDTDVELKRNLDSLLVNQCFVGMEDIGRVATGLAMGCEAENPFVVENKMYYETANFYTRDGAFAPKICVDITTDILLHYGLKKSNEVQNLHAVTVYPTDYFCPLRMGKSKPVITKNTYSIHWYDASWYSGSPLIHKLNYKLIPLKIIIKKILGRY